MKSEEINDILNVAQKLVFSGKWEIYIRAKNDSFRHNYIFTEEDLESVILGLNVNDFDQRQPTMDKQLNCRWLYVFFTKVRLIKRVGRGEEEITLYLKFGFIDNAKRLLLVSCHKAEHPAI